MDLCNPMSTCEAFINNDTLDYTFSGSWHIELFLCTYIW